MTSSTRRLFELLNRIHQEGTRLGSGTSIGVVLRRVMANVEVDTRELFGIYTDIVRLADRAIDEVRAAYANDPSIPTAEEDLNLVLQPLTSLRDTLLASSIQSQVGVLLQHNPAQFQVQAVTMSRIVRQREPTADELKRVRDALREALDTVLGSNLSDPFKAAFQQAIERILRMVDNYSIFGPDAVLHAFGALVGELAVQPEARSEHGAPIVTSALGRVADAASIITAAVQLGLLIRPIVQLYLNA